MKLLSLEIENFGVFRRQSLNLAGNFQLVYGPNEAGKSTLLQLLRETLFGFRERNPYEFDNHSGDMAITARCELRDGRIARFRRSKRRTSPVTGEFEATGEKLDDTTLKRLLTHAAPKLYDHIFAFSLAELAAGEQSLKEANLNDALYGSGWGGVSGFSATRKRLEQEAKELFAPNARTGSQINGLLGQMRTKRTEFQEAAVRPEKHRFAREYLALFEHERNLAREERGDLQRRQSRLERLNSALPLHFQLVENQRLLEQCSAPASFPIELQADLGRLKQRLEGTLEEIAENNDALARVCGRLADLRPNPKLCSQKSNLLRLREQVQKIRDIRRDLPQRRAESEAKRETVIGQLRSLNPAWSLAQLGQFTTSLAQRERIEGMRNELENLSRNLELLRRTHAQLAGEVANLANRCETAAAPAAPELLEGVLLQEGIWRANAERLRETEKNLQTSASRTEHIGQRLNAPLAEPLVDLATAAVPLAATVAEFRTRLADAEKAARDARQRCEDITREIRELTRNRQELAAHEKLPDRSQLAQARQHRDHGWHLIRRTLLAGENAAAEVAAWLGQAPHALPEAYEAAVSEADQVADHRLAKAERAAALDQLSADIERRQRSLVEAEDELNKRTQALGAIEADWRSAWQRSRIVPLSPEAMYDWLRTHGELLDEAEKHRQLTVDYRDLCQRVQEFAEEFQKIYGKHAGPLEAQLHQAAQWVKRTRDEATSRNTLSNELAEKRRQLQALEHDLRQAEHEREQWQARWLPLIEEFGFPAEWDIHLACKILTGLNAARLEFQQVESLDQRVQDMQTDFHAFCIEAQSLALELGPDTAELPQEDAVVELCRRLEQAESDHRQKQELDRQQSELTRIDGEKQKQREDYEAQRRELFRRAGVANEAEFYELARQAEQRKQLENAAIELRKQLAIARASEEPESFQTDLENTPSDELSRELGDLKVDLARADERFENAVREVATASQDLKALEEEQEPLERAAEMESQRAQLVDYVEQWAPRRLALKLLNRAVERFERENRPELLAGAGELFSRMTAGRYRALKRDLGEEGLLLVEDEAGQFKQPDQLSTGTREQLYLAIRLAYLRYLARTNEPLPVVMDDVLANFDDGRARQTLAVLLELAEEMQIIFLSCHESRVQMFRELRPEGTVLNLGDSREREAASLAAGAPPIAEEPPPKAKTRRAKT